MTRSSVESPDAGASSGELSERVRASLAPLADPTRAVSQQAYMRSTMPFLGVPLPEVRRATRAVVRAVNDPEMLVSTVESLWEGATHREHRYAAMTVLASRPLASHDRLLPLDEHIVRTGQWWDITDDVANRVAERLDLAPDGTAELMRAWAVDDDLWIRRVSIISQLPRRDRTDLRLLSDAIDANVDDPDFFIRKAIGWALRQHAKVDPDWVRSFVTARNLSPLSRREALKHIGE